MDAVFIYRLTSTPVGIYLHVASITACFYCPRLAAWVFVAFDLLYCNGFNLLGASQLDRKALLNAIIKSLPANSVVRYSEHLEMAGNGDLLRKACKMGLEGVVSKRADAPYISGRAGHWIKAKCHLRQEFVKNGRSSGGSGPDLQTKTFNNNRVRGVVNA